MIASISQRVANNIHPMNDNSGWESYKLPACCLWQWQDRVRERQGGRQQRFHRFTCGGLGEDREVFRVPGRRCACTQNAVSMAFTSQFQISRPFFAAVLLVTTKTYNQAFLTKGKLIPAVRHSSTHKHKQGINIMMFFHTITGWPICSWTRLWHQFRLIPRLSLNGTNVNIT